MEPVLSSLKASVMSSVMLHPLYSFAKIAHKAGSNVG